MGLNVAVNVVGVCAGGSFGEGVRGEVEEDGGDASGRVVNLIPVDTAQADGQTPGEHV